MLKKTQFILSFVYIKSIIIFSSIFILNANSETEIIAKNGDTLLKLSNKYGISLKELMQKNNFNNADRELEGEVIIIPSNNIQNDYKHHEHKVIEGETLYKIARKYEVNVKDLISINKLNTDSILKPNQIILLPKTTLNKKITNQTNINLANKKVFYHQTSEEEELSKIAKIHDVSIEEIITLNKLNTPIKINPNTKLKIRETEILNWIRYGPLIINWASWSYLDGSYITQAKNKKNKSFFLAINCEERTLNNTLNNSYWNRWYFPKSDFEFKLISDFCS